MTQQTAVAGRRRAVPTEGGKSNRRLFQNIGLPIIGIVTAFAIWWGACELFDIRTFFVPKPPEIVEAFFRAPDYMLKQLLVTLIETLVGFGVATLFGLVISIVLAASESVQRATLPLLVSLNSVPKVAIAPLLVVWLGFGKEPKIVMVAFICFFPVVVSTMAGLTSTPAELGELVKSLSASRTQAYLKVRLPWALPQIFVGLKVASSLAVIGAVVAEISNPQEGLGAVIVASGANADTPLAFASITLLALLSVSLFYAIAGLERLLLPWAKAISG
jgi:NitT/TauT family transport system permease protein